LTGGTACQQACRVPGSVFEDLAKECSDRNLATAATALGIDEGDLLMVGVTEDKVGFYEEYYDGWSRAATVNSRGITEIPGYNAFFSSDKNQVLGARLADCGFAAVTFKGAHQEDVSGFVHLNRANLQGETALKFEVDDKPAGSFQYFLQEALRYYGGDISTVQVRVVAGISSENYHHQFNQGKGPEELFPGWAEQGLLKNLSNSSWQAGDVYDPDDVFEPQYRDMMRWQILRSGIAPEQLDETDMIDPADLTLGHASNSAGRHGKMAAGHDAYLLVPRGYRPMPNLLAEVADRDVAQRPSLYDRLDEAELTTPQYNG
jgi:hypothetical protein